MYPYLIGENRETTLQRLPMIMRKISCRVLGQVWTVGKAISRLREHFDNAIHLETNREFLRISGACGSGVYNARVSGQTFYISQEFCISGINLIDSSCGCRGRSSELDRRIKSSK